MSPILFWLLAALMLIAGVSVVLQRNPVASALSLVVCFLALAALFVGLDAFFIGIIQVLVYAGAVMVLFLFIIMLLDLKAEKRRKLNFLTVGGGIVVAASFVYQLVLVLQKHPEGNQPFPTLIAPVEDVYNVGMTLFSSFNLPFQAIGVLILVATIGVVVLSKRELK